MANTKITADNLATNAVTSASIADNSIGITQLNVSDGSNGQALVTNGSGTLSFASVGVSGISSSADATAITIDANEKVGVGTASPAQTLHVNSGASNVVARFESSDSIAVASFKDNNGEAEIGNIGNDIGFFPAGAEKARLTSGGNFGIGTTNPSTKLEVYDGSLTINAPSATGNAWTFYKNSDRTYLVGIRGSSSDALSFYDLTTDAERMRIDSTGKVGIGTTSPSTNLSIFNSSPAWNQYATLRLASENEGAYYGEVSFHRGTSDDTDRGLVFNLGGTERMRILNSGKVGIGTTSPSHPLHVVSSGNGEIKAERSSGAAILLQAQSAAGKIGTSSNHSLGLNTNGTTRLTIDTSGNVGIGTTDTGNAKLVINGNTSSGANTACIDFDGYGTYGADNSQSINFRMGRTGQATDQAAQIMGIFQGGGATAGQTSVGFKFNTISANTLTEQFLIDAAYLRFKFNTTESPRSNNPQTNRCIIIGPSTSTAVTAGLTDATVLINRSGELYAVDSSHNNTQLTPHNWTLIPDGPSEELAWTYWSQRPNPDNPDQLQGINVDMAKVARKVEDLIGEKLVYTENSNMDDHTHKNIIADIQSTLADLTTRIEALEG